MSMSGGGWGGIGGGLPPGWGRAGSLAGAPTPAVHVDPRSENPLGPSTFILGNGVDNSGAGQFNAAQAVNLAQGPENQQARYAQQQAARYGQMQQNALGYAAPTIAKASQAELNQSRNQLGSLANAYGQVARGVGPMGQLAQNQFQSALGQSMASNLAMAHSAQGGALGGASAMRNAEQQNAQAGAGAAAQSGMIQAQQQQAGLAGQAGAYGQLGQMNLAQYQTAQQIAQEQALIQQQQRGQNEGFYSNLASAQTNQQQIANQSTQALAGLGVQAGLGEAGTAVGAQNATTNMIGMGANIGGAAASSLSSGLAGAGGTSDVNAKTAVQSEGTHVTPVNNAKVGGGEATVTSSAATSGQIAGGAGQGALTGAVKGAGIGSAIGSILPGIGNAIGAVVGGLAGGVAGGVSGGESTAGARNVTGVSDGSGNFQPGGSSAFSPSAGGLAGAGVGAAEDVASVASDERLKFQEQQGRASMADQLLEHLRPYSFQYKNPMDEPRDPTGGRYLGVMAQDIERTPEVGHQIVQDTPTGKKINYGAGLSAALAGIGRLNERLSALESHDDGDMGDRLNESVNPTLKGGGPRKATTSASLAKGIAALQSRLAALEGRK